MKIHLRFTSDKGAVKLGYDKVAFTSYAQLISWCLIAKRTFFCINFAQNLIFSILIQLQLPK